MERPTDEILQRLLAAVAAGDVDAARLVDAARAEAEAEVKDVIKSAMKAVLLRRAVDHLDAAQPFEGRARGTTATTQTQPPSEPAAAEPVVAHRTAGAADRATACYVYGITRTSWGTPPAALVGLGGFKIRTTRHDDLQAITTDVPLDEFGPGAIDERLKDLQWVERNVRGHDGTLKALSEFGTIIPCRFCTILSDEQEARAALDRHRHAIVATLASLDGKKEWGVKLMADTRRSAGGASGGDAGGRDGEASGESGRGYLMQKKRQGRHRDDALREVQRAAAEAAEVVHRELFTLTADAALLPTRDRGAGRGWHLALNAAYLVDGAGESAFHAAVADLARRFHPRGLRLDLTGPWPPYNFAALNLSAAPA